MAAVASKNAEWDVRVEGECVREEGEEMPRWGCDYWPKCKKNREELDEYDERAKEVAAEGVFNPYRCVWQGKEVSMVDAIEVLSAGLGAETEVASDR